MSLIQCDEPCRFQKDGFCRLEDLGTVNSTENDCPHFKPYLFDIRDGLFETSDSNQL